MLPELKFRNRTLSSIRMEEILTEEEAIYLITLGETAVGKAEIEIAEIKRRAQAYHEFVEPAVLTAKETHLNKLKALVRIAQMRKGQIRREKNLAIKEQELEIMRESVRTKSQGLPPPPPSLKPCVVRVVDERPLTPTQKTTRAGVARQFMEAATRVLSKDELAKVWDEVARISR